MEKLKLKVATVILALSGLGFTASPPLYVRPDDMPVFLNIPSADLISHGQYRLAGRFQYFTMSEPGSSDTLFKDSSSKETQSLNYSSELLFGIENRAEVGFQYGQVFSLSLKALLIREDLFWPDLVFGVRNLFGSQEATLYGVTDTKITKALENESYATLAKSFASGSRMHLGLSVLPDANKGFASMNAGIDQDLGRGATLGYEVFERFSDFHQILQVQWKYRNMIALSFGLTEFQSWIRQGGEWGFFLTPKQPLKDGYNSPGISISLQVLGWVPHRDKKTLPERVTALEVKNVDIERELESLVELKKQVEDLQTAVDTLPLAIKLNNENGTSKKEGPSMGPFSGKTPFDKVQNQLRSIADKMQSDLSDPNEIRAMMSQLISMGPGTNTSLKRIALDTSNLLRIPAVLVMAYSKDAAYNTSLKILCSDSDPQMRREALTAYVKSGKRAALEETKKLLSDPDASVALAAGEAYRQITGEEPPGAKSKSKEDARGTGSAAGVENVGSGRNLESPIMAPSSASGKDLPANEPAKTTHPESLKTVPVKGPKLKKK